MAPVTASQVTLSDEWLPPTGAALSPVSAAWVAPSASSDASTSSGLASVSMAETFTV